MKCDLYCLVQWFIEKLQIILALRIRLVQITTIQLEVNGNLITTLSSVLRVSFLLSRLMLQDKVAFLTA